MVSFGTNTCLKLCWNRLRFHVIGRRGERNVLRDLGNNVDERLDTMYVCMCLCTCARVCIIEQIVEMYINAVHAVGACATIKLA